MRPNKDLIHKLIRIVEHGKRWHQSAWFSKMYASSKWCTISYAVIDDLIKPKDILHECGTYACIAGWALALDPGTRNVPIEVGHSKVVQPIAQHVLGLSGRQANLLFDGSNRKAAVLEMLNALLDAPDNRSEDDLDEELFSIYYRHRP